MVSDVSFPPLTRPMSDGQVSPSTNQRPPTNERPKKNFPPCTAYGKCCFVSISAMDIKLAEDFIRKYKQQEEVIEHQERFLIRQWQQISLARKIMLLSQANAAQEEKRSAMVRKKVSLKKSESRKRSNLIRKKRLASIQKRLIQNQKFVKTPKPQEESDNDVQFLHEVPVVIQKYFCKTCRGHVTTVVTHLFERHYRKSVVRCPLCPHFQFFSYLKVKRHITRRHPGVDANPLDQRKRHKEGIRNCWEEHIREEIPHDFDSVFRRAVLKKKMKTVTKPIENIIDLTQY